MQHRLIKRRFIRITFVIIALAAGAAVLVGDIVHGAAQRKLREAILAELQPVALKNCTLKRFGSENDGGTFVFHDECVGDRTGYRKSRFFDTLKNQIRKNGDTGRRLVIKMDIEGAEWDSLLAALDELLALILVD